MLVRYADVKRISQGQPAESVVKFAQRSDELAMMKADAKKADRQRRRPQHLPNVDNLRPEMEERKAMMETAEGRAELERIDAIIDKADRARKAIENARALNQIKAHVLRHGFRWSGGEMGGYWHDAFIERGLRSDCHPWLKAMVASFPRAGKLVYDEKGRVLKQVLMTGENKQFMLPTDSKLLALYSPYAEGNKIVVGWIKADLDAVFNSWGDLYLQLLDLDIPMPHIGCAYERPNGQVVRPHLIWLLPIGNGIRRGKGAKAQPQALLKAVRRGIVEKLLPLGADAGALSNPMRVKNPLSPFWSVAILSEAEPLSLSDWTGHVNLNVKVEDLQRRQIEIHAAAEGIAPHESNECFNILRFATYEASHQWWLARRTKVTKRTFPGLSESEKEDLSRHLYDTLGHDARVSLKDGERPDQAMAILEKVVEWVVDAFDPNKLVSDRENRGILREAVAGKDLRQKQQDGQAYTAQVVADRTLEKLVAAVRKLGGHGCSKAKAAAIAGVHRDTAHRRWPEIISALESGVSMPGVVRARMSYWVYSKKAPAVVGEARAEEETHDSLATAASNDNVPREVPVPVNLRKPGHPTTMILKPMPHRELDPDEIREILSDQSWKSFSANGPHLSAAVVLGLGRKRAWG